MIYLIRCYSLLSTGTLWVNKTKYWTAALWVYLTGSSCGYIGNIKSLVSTILNLLGCKFSMFIIIYPCMMFWLSFSPFLSPCAGDFTGCLKFWKLRSNSYFDAISNCYGTCVVVTVLLSGKGLACVLWILIFYFEPKFWEDRWPACFSTSVLL